MFSPGLLILALAARVGGEKNLWGSYVLDAVKSSSRGFTGRLTLGNASKACPYGELISPLLLEVVYASDDTVNVRITDPAVDRWEVPGVVERPGVSSGTPLTRQYSVEYSAPGDTFRLSIVRVGSALASDYQTVFDSTELYFADQYLEWGTSLPADPGIYGLGERHGPLRFEVPDEAATYSFIASNGGTHEKVPLYSSHPYYMEVRSEEDAGSESVGVLLLNSNPLDVELGAGALRYKITGGVLDLWVVMGPTPDQVTRQYQRLVGRPHLPPRWALGYHQSRRGYGDHAALERVLEGFEKRDLPRDVLWVDGEASDHDRIFTLDPEAFPEPDMAALRHRLHAAGRRFVPMLSPGVLIAANYSAYEEGTRLGVFVRDPDGADFHVAAAANGPVLLPDWTHPETPGYWAGQVGAFRQAVKWDGIGLDLNEPTSLCDGRCKVVAGNCTTCEARFNGTERWDLPLYRPADTVGRECRTVGPDPVDGLDCGTLSMASRHYLAREYDVHNLYGHWQAAATRAALDGPERPFVVTRSTFPGTGRVAAHWLGDNAATWEDLRSSVAGVLSMNLVGVPMVGANVCGSQGPASEELCARWMQLGAFYPFFRNHNAAGEPDQAPFDLGEQVLAIAREALGLRYSLVPYWYTLFHTLHTEGGAALRPLFYDFPEDGATLGLDAQFMVGPALLASPVLERGKRSHSVYFPAGARWYDWDSGFLTMDLFTVERWVKLSTPLDKVDLHVRGGYVVPVRDPAGCTRDQEGRPLHLVVALNNETDLVGAERARGKFFSDDGAASDWLESGNFTELVVVVTNNASESARGGFDVHVRHVAGDVPQAIASVTVLGWSCPVDCIDVKHAPNVSEAPVRLPATRVRPSRWVPGSGHHVMLRRYEMAADSVVRMRCICDAPPHGPYSKTAIIIVCVLTAITAVATVGLVRSRREPHLGDSYAALIDPEHDEPRR